MKIASLHRTLRRGALNLDKGVLHELYVEKKLSCTKVAETLNVSPNSVKRYLNLHGFKIRHESTYKVLPLPKDEIIAMYVDEGISATKIAKKYNTCTGTISDRLKKWGVDILHGTPIFETCNYSRCDESVKVWPKDIRNSKYDCFYCCIDHKNKGIAERGINAGENSATWQGGKSYEPYCPIWLDKEYKEDIRARDNYRCSNPDCWNTVDKLSIHHIDYDKKNCHPDNLITVCVSCNSRANVDRRWHKSWYTAIMQRSGKTRNNNQLNI